MKKNKLHNITTSGFKTPKHYFESFEADFFERLNEKEAIEASEKSGYSVPENYFDTIEGKVLDQLQDKQEPPVIQLKPKRTLYYLTGIAASIVLLFSLVFNTDTITLDTIETSSIETFLYQNEYSNDDFATLFNSNDISESDFIDVNISDETLNQYLEHIDPEDLILE
ncbi:hypothetical protein [Winogradskyella sp. SM1960]|uniref:hypothetical protein n=1 Tax=Winogradskyella sp. SM1960 TaxID=2865955 RepID=UPI001CD37FB9|nr:hypothetical protein [Winogradskyella sp. SM1960]